MTSKDLAIDFLNLVFSLILISSSILYFIVGNNFEKAKQFFVFLAPFSLFLLLIAIRIKVGKNQIKKRKREENMVIVLNLTYYDKLKMDIVTLSIPVVMLLTKYTINKNINFTDIIQSILILTIVWYSQKIIFKE